VALFASPDQPGWLFARSRFTSNCGYFSRTKSLCTSAGRHAARRSPAYGRQRRNRRDELNNTHPNRPSQFFETQLAGGAVEEIN
jgi:hypothetical protein